MTIVATRQYKGIEKTGLLIVAISATILGTIAVATTQGGL